MALVALWIGTGPSTAETGGSGPRVLPEVVERWNSMGVVQRPANAEAASRYSVDHEAHRIAYNFQAPGIAAVPLPDGRVRLWLSWYQQNNKPGGGAIGGGSIAHTVYAYSDDPFGTAKPVWTPVLYAEPVIALGGETASDPEVALLPDGRLLGSYITSGPGRDRKRSTYAFLIANPAATNGVFQLGRQHWLEYGVLSQPFEVKGEPHAVIDEWSVARRFCRLDFSATPERDALRAVRLSDIPWPGPKSLTSFFEGSMHVVSGDRYRAYRRTTNGVYTTLSETGGRVWGTEEKWNDFPSSESRSAFARSPYSGRIIGAVNCSTDGPRYRTNLTLAMSEEEGAPGSFRRSLNLEPDDGKRSVAAQYPRLAFDRAGYVYCVYRWSDKRPGAPHHGAAIVVARVREDLLAAGKATLADVDKRAACEITPSK
ncbi:MAG: exo-alpha-sialidase [Verrucomicrobia bacterium]|nr:exo-alpha-sialidase [Verrucomicrobiota bacterium]